jgi:hypothetical protein
MPVFRRSAGKHIAYNLHLAGDVRMWLAAPRRVRSVVQHEKERFYPPVRRKIAIRDYQRPVPSSTFAWR